MASMTILLLMTVFPTFMTSSGFYRARGPV